MPPRIAIGNSFMRQVMKATGLSTKKAVVEEGLRLLIKVKGQEGIRRLREKSHRSDLSVMCKSDNNLVPCLWQSGYCPAMQSRPS
jgi:Arc/MetJ family transcription regulator